MPPIVNSIRILYSYCMDTPPVKPRADAQRNYELLVRATKDAIAATGSIPALDFIAKKAGVGIGTLYRHFPTRGNLLKAIYADNIAALVTEAAELVCKPDVSPVAAVQTWLQKAVHYSLDDAGFGEMVELSIHDKQSPLLVAGSQLMDRAQDMRVFRSDITILDLLRFTHSITSDTGPEMTHDKADALVSVIVAGAQISQNSDIAR